MAPVDLSQYRPEVIAAAGLHTRMSKATANALVAHADDFQARTKKAATKHSRDACRPCHSKAKKHRAYYDDGGGNFRWHTYDAGPNDTLRSWKGRKGVPALGVQNDCMAELQALGVSPDRIVTGSWPDPERVERDRDKAKRAAMFEDCNGCGTGMRAINTVHFVDHMDTPATYTAYCRRCGDAARAHRLDLAASFQAA